MIIVIVINIAIQLNVILIIKNNYNNSNHDYIYIGISPTTIHLTVGAYKARHTFANKYRSRRQTCATVLAWVWITRTHF